MPKADEQNPAYWCGLNIRLVRGNTPFPMWLVRARPEQHVRHLLSDTELQRMARFRDAALRDRYASGHAALRLLVERYAGIPAREQHYESDTFGKPRLVGHTALGHNLSHSGDRTLIGISSASEIGVDIERIKPIEDGPDIACELFTARERIMMRRANGRPNLSERRFFTIWTRKEACVKALGPGLQIPLQKLHCGAGRQVGHIRFDQHRIRNGVVDNQDGYSIAWAEIEIDTPK